MRDERDLDAIPHSREDEQYLLGVCFFTEKAALDVAARVEPEDFYLPLNNRAFTAIQALTDRGEAITFHSVALEIRRQLPEEEKDNPFEAFSSFELQSGYDKQEYRDVRGIPAACGRLRELRARRDIMTASRITLAGASTKPIEELLSIYEETGAKILRHNRGGVITQANGVIALSSLYDKLKTGELDVIPTAFPELNRMLWGGGFWGGDNIVIAGETSTGKTTLALNITTDAALSGYRTLYFSREMSYLKLLMRIQSRLAKVPAWKIRPRMDEYGEGIRQRLAATMDLIDSLPMYWDDKTGDIGNIRRVAKDYVRNEGVQLITIDYLKLIRARKGFKGSTADRVSSISYEVKDMATELNVPVIDISQLSRAPKDEKGGEPSLERLKDSGDVENDADVVAMIWRNKEEQEEGSRNQMLDAYCKLAKQRQGELGRFKLKFAPDIYAFTSLEQLRDKERELATLNF